MPSVYQEAGYWQLALGAFLLLTAGICVLVYFARNKALQRYKYEKAGKPLQNSRSNILSVQNSLSSGVDTRVASSIFSNEGSRSSSVDRGGKMVTFICLGCLLVGSGRVCIAISLILVSPRRASHLLNGFGFPLLGFGFWLFVLGKLQLLAHILLIDSYIQGKRFMSSIEGRKQLHIFTSKIPSILVAIVALLYFSLGVLYLIFQGIFFRISQGTFTKLLKVFTTVSLVTRIVQSTQYCLLGLAFATVTLYSIMHFRKQTMQSPGKSLHRIWASAFFVTASMFLMAYVNVLFGAFDTISSTRLNPLQAEAENVFINDPYIYAILGGFGLPCAGIIGLIGVWSSAESCALSIVDEQMHYEASLSGEFLDPTMFRRPAMIEGLEEDRLLDL